MDSWLELSSSETFFAMYRTASSCTQRFVPEESERNERRSEYINRTDRTFLLTYKIFIHYLHSEQTLIENSSVDVWGHANTKCLQLTKRFLEILANRKVVRIVRVESTGNLAGAFCVIGAIFIAEQVPLVPHRERNCKNPSDSQIHFKQSNQNDSSFLLPTTHWHKIWI